MKKLLALLLSLLLICTIPAALAAGEVTDTFTSTLRSGSVTDGTENGQYCTMNFGVQYGPEGWRVSSSKKLEFKANDGYQIKSIELVIYDAWPVEAEVCVRSVAADPGSLSYPTYAPGAKIEVQDVNAAGTTVTFNGTTGFVDFSQIIVHLEKVALPTGDTTTPVLWVAFTLTSAAALIVLSVRRRREF